VGVLVICTQTEVFHNLTEVFLTLTEVFPCFFFSCNANAKVKHAKTGHGPQSLTLVVVRLLFVLFCVLFVCKCVLYYYHWVTTQLQFTNISHHIISYFNHTSHAVGILWSSLLTGLTTHNIHKRVTSMHRWDSNPHSQQARGRRLTHTTRYLVDDIK
jgi:magnesium-transporting ATPase (P-type)